jgi:transcriptional regulator NrdR family protein
MTLSVNIIKNNRMKTSESFNRDKLHTSIIAACLSVYVPDGQAESIAHAVCDGVVTWLQQHPEVTSRDIRTVATKNLKIYHPEAAYLYEQHHITI